MERATFLVEVNLDMSELTHEARMSKALHFLQFSLENTIKHYQPQVIDTQVGYDMLARSLDRLGHLLDTHFDLEDDSAPFEAVLGELRQTIVQLDNQPF